MAEGGKKFKRPARSPSTGVEKRVYAKQLAVASESTAQLLAPSRYKGAVERVFLLDSFSLTRTHGVLSRVCNVRSLHKDQREISNCREDRSIRSREKKAGLSSRPGISSPLSWETDSTSRQAICFPTTNRSFFTRTPYPVVSFFYAELVLAVYRMQQNRL